MISKLAFKFSWRLTIVVLVLVPMFISLGFWQLYRAQEKRLLQAKFDAQQKMPPLSLEQAARLPDPRYYPIQVEGHFDNTHTFLLDNQFNAHTVGYNVITPFVIDPHPRPLSRVPEREEEYARPLSHDPGILLINRGWIPKHDRSSPLPLSPHQPPFISGKVYINGLLYLPHKNPFISDVIETRTWPQPILALNTKLLSQRLGRTVYPWIMLLDAKSPYGFVRHWQPVNMKASMHMGYAFQWFSMAGALCIIYFAMSLRRHS
jgi:surfeit locus 1 family protein